MASRLLGSLTVLLIALHAAPAVAQDGMCRIVDADFTPTEDLQIVVWIETADGTYVDTAFITRQTGTYGLGNRPGMFTFNSGPLWPYGRRETTFPVWAGRHGLEWPLLVFQDGNDTNLSHALSQSSSEAHYCRPIREDEALWNITMDSMTCATSAFTDKGTFATTTSRYPPRADLVRDQNKDDVNVTEMATMNPFDAVSRATPAGGMNHTASWLLPSGIPDGDYVLWVEVSKENDPNATYNFPEPVGIPWSDYGTPYRGQPSVVYRVPFEITHASGEQVATVTEYHGYGDPGPMLHDERPIDHNVRPPDATISNTPGSGAGRLLLTAGEGDEMYRVRVRSRTEFDAVAPGGAGQFEAGEVTANTAALSFIAPGDDDQTGQVMGYEVRYLAGETVTEDNWSSATLADVVLLPGPPGTVHEFSLDGLLPSTSYSVGVRAKDECLNEGPVVAANLITPRGQPDSVSYCFVATAAYGSSMAQEVDALRNFRDSVLRTTVWGELAVAGYYTFGPLAAAVIQESDDLRAASRGLLKPVVDYALERR